MMEYESFTFSTAADALAEIRRQHLAGEPLVWTGPDRLHHSVSATSPEPSWLFSDEGMTYMAERDHDFWDVYTMVAFHLGFHSGTLKEEEHTNQWKRLAQPIY